MVHEASSTCPTSERSDSAATIVLMHYGEPADRSIFEQADHTHESCNLASRGAKNLNHMMHRIALKMLASANCGQGRNAEKPE